MRENLTSAIESSLVGSRTCGNCAVCCRVVMVDDPDLHKPPGCLCQHWTPAGGCGVYTDRSASCRDWYCGWRLLPQLTSGWRPDRSNVLVELTQQDLPAESKRDFCVKLTTLRGHRALTTKKALAFIVSLLSQDYAVYLATLPEPGKTSGKTLLSVASLGREHLNNTARLKAWIRRGLQVAESVPARPVKFVTG